MFYSFQGDGHFSQTLVNNQICHCSLITIFVAMGNIITILSSNCPFTKSFQKNSKNAQLRD